VYTGENALALVKENPLNIDLILMDINFGSGMDGTQAAEQILHVADIPIIFLSSHTEPQVVEKTEKITSYGYVVKSSSITVLDASIKMAFKLKKANQLIETEKKNLEQIFSANPVGMMIVNENYEVVKVNRTAETITGRELSSLNKPRCGDFLGCVNRNFLPKICGYTIQCTTCLLYADIQKAIHERTKSEIIEREFTVEGTDNKTGEPSKEQLWIRYSVSPIHLDTNTAAIVVFEDTRLERALNAHLQKFQRLIDSTNVLILTTDSNRKTTWANDAFTLLTGYTLEELLDKNPGELLQGPSPNQELKQQMTHAFDKGESFQTDILNFHKNGMPYWVHMDVQPIYDQLNNLEGFISIQRDISAEKKNQIDLAERDHRFWTLLREMDRPFSIFRGDGKAMFANEAFAREAGLPLDRIMKMNVQDIMNLVHQEDRQKIDALAQKAISEGAKSFEYRYRVKSSSGEYYWREDKVRVFFDSNGRVDQFWISG